MEKVSLAAESVPVSTLTVMVLLGPVVVAYGCMLLKNRNMQEAVDVSLTGKRVPGLKRTRQSVMLLMKEFSVLGALMLYAWVCENAPIYPHEQKEHLPDFFWFICLVVLVFAFGSLEFHEGADDLVNRDQTEEWKGWMQTVFLLYHYFHESEVYNIVRVMISCYVWMTGFGNFSFFYIKSDFGWVRFMQMMWRLNFTVLFLCLTMNNMYILYYICPLHTFYFLIVYATMRIAPSLNHTHYPIRVKLMIVGVLLFIVWESSTIFNIVFSFIPNEPHPGAAVGQYGVQYEWHFRSGLDHYSTFFGMIFACNFPQSTLWIRKVEQLPASQEWLIKGTVGAFLMIATFWWASEIFPLPKLEFNSWNPYTFMIPLLSYLFFRNLSPWLRKVHLGILANIGKYTLETYLMQHHVWLTSNAKTVLVFVPGFPKINLLLVTCLYFAYARRIFRVTMTTRALLIPDDPSYSAYLLAMFAGSVGIAGIIAWILQALGAPWLVVIPLIVGMGVVMYSVVDNIVCAQEPIASPRSVIPWRSAISNFFIWSAVAIIAIFIMPSIYNAGAPINEGPLRPHGPKLSQTVCLAGLNKGEWFVDSSAACHGPNDPVCVGESWTWANSFAEMDCNFHRFDSTEAALVLANKKVVFIGDDATYFLALEFASLVDSKQSFNPAKGMVLPANKIKADPTFRHPSIDFFFAENVEKVQTLFDSVDFIQRPDLIVVGAWLKDLKEGADSISLLQKWRRFSAAMDVKNLVILTPSAIFPEKATDFDSSASPSAARVAERLQFEKATNEAAVAAFVVDMHEITRNRFDDSPDGIHFSSITLRAAVQVLYNGLEMIYPLPKKESTSSVKGHGGGLAISPERGIAILFLATVMLFFMDNYGGISVLVAKILPPHISLDWEESVKELHSKIPSLSNSSARYEKVSEDDEDDDAEKVAVLGENSGNGNTVEMVQSTN